MIFRRESDATRKNTRLRAAVVAGAVITVPLAGLLTATTASAATTSTWDAVAQCESTGNWSANTGNGFSGGLQFTPSTWAAYGGTQYAASADQATQSQQISVAEAVLASQGPGAWPVCGPQAGLAAGGPAADVSTASNGSASSGSAATSAASGTAATGSNAGSGTNSTSGSGYTGNSTGSGNSSAVSGSADLAAAPAASSGSATAGSYTVHSGDTLGGIAAANGTTWQHLYSVNSGTIGANPNLITPGEVLVLG